ncbi:hypothetical protein B0H16DRAFT_1489187 [Mycena metata]|uniref:Uncharacterized protein n=1 Tax=Mycena metata TaxID=1033252 RepID=A0AAD7KHW8_9AGAR|nr:hypothetical protein B0H16DRAFT_1489187 [Mycena metata]
MTYSSVPGNPLETVPFQNYQHSYLVTSRSILSTPGSYRRVWVRSGGKAGRRFVLVDLSSFLHSSVDMGARRLGAPWTMIYHQENVLETMYNEDAPTNLRATPHDAGERGGRHRRGGCVQSDGGICRSRRCCCCWPGQMACRRDAKQSSQSAKAETGGATHSLHGDRHRSGVGSRNVLSSNCRGGFGFSARSQRRRGDSMSGGSLRSWSSRSSRRHRIHRHNRRRAKRDSRTRPFLVDRDCDRHPQASRDETK